MAIKYEQEFKKIYKSFGSDSFLLLDNNETEKQCLIKARVGQSKYRRKMIKMWNGCSVTGFSEYDSILIASHIKPWSVSSSNERCDPYNGFLLKPNLDKLFDGGFISFNMDGMIQISNYIKNTEDLLINHDMCIKKLKDRNKIYLEYHLKKVFQK